jgi:hypothetical protein
MEAQMQYERMQQPPVYDAANNPYGTAGQPGSQAVSMLSVRSPFEWRPDHNNQLSYSQV